MARTKPGIRTRRKAPRSAARRPKYVYSFANGKAEGSSALRHLLGGKGCELAEMTYPRFRQIASESPGLIFELATQMATRLTRTNRKLSDLAFVDVTGRVAHAIRDLCNEPDAMTHPQGMQIKVSRQELSRLVGCSREMAGRVLKVLEEQGLLRATGKTIVVFNARPKMKTRPVIVPTQVVAGKKGGPAAPTRSSRDDDDDDFDDEDDE